MESRSEIPKVGMTHGKKERSTESRNEARKTGGLKLDSIVKFTLYIMNHFLMYLPSFSFNIRFDFNLYGK